MSDTTQRELTFGERAVGLTFNPGNDPKVQIIKEACAKVIDVLNHERNVIKDLGVGNSPEEGARNADQLRMLSIAITEIQTGQMWGVKAVTWK